MKNSQRSVFTFSTVASQSPVRLYPLFRESRIRSEILLKFYAGVTRISLTNNNQRMYRERGGIWAAERLCLLVCIISAEIRARQGLALWVLRSLDAP